MFKMKWVLFVVLILMIAIPAFSQSWVKERGPMYTYDGVFADTTADGQALVSGGHGVVVDKNNRIWIGSYWSGNTGGIVVLNPDGSPALFSPITQIAFADTTFDFTTGSNHCRGMNLDKDGNILWARGSTLIKINPDDGTGMAYWIGDGSMLKPAVDSEGYIYVGKVVGINPVRVIDPATFTVTQEIVLDGAPGYARGMEVSPDGKTIITGNLSGGDSPVPIYTTEDYVTYTLSDSISTDMYGQSIFKYQKVTMDWGPNGKLWISHDDSYAARGQAENGFVIVDLAAKKYSYLFIPQDSTEYNGPRGISFSATGDTAYTISWNANKVYRFVAAEAMEAGPWAFDDGLANFAYDGVFADTTADGMALVSGGHGVVVDKNNRIWIGSYWSGNTGGIVVLNPDSTFAPFAPITQIVFSDTTFDFTTGSNHCRGMNIDKDGNILWARGSTLIKINPDDGTGMAYWVGDGSMLKPAVDSEGYIYVGKVVGINPVRVIDPATFTVTQEIVLDGAPGYARGLEVSADGKTLIPGNLSGGASAVPIYTTEDYVTYTMTDSLYTDTNGYPLFKYQKVTMDWGPNGNLWISHDDSYAAKGQPENGFVIVDLQNKKYDYLFIPQDSSEYNGPRGVAFSATGDTAYTVSWNANKVYRFTRLTTGVFDEPFVTDVPRNFELLQNYPNPFNPTTTIPFALQKQGLVQLKVFNIMGREVATLLNKVLPQGRHTVQFNASGLASGTYYYQLKINDQLTTKKMLLVK